MGLDARLDADLMQKAEAFGSPQGNLNASGPQQILRRGVPTGNGLPSAVQVVPQRTPRHEVKHCNSVLLLRTRSTQCDQMFVS